MFGRKKITSQPPAAPDLQSGPVDQSLEGQALEAHGQALPQTPEALTQASGGPFREGKTKPLGLLSGWSQERSLTWLIAMVVLLTSAFFVAQGATQYAASYLWSPPTVRAGMVAQQSNRTRKDGRPILARNIFDSQTGSMPWDAPIAPVEPTGAAEVVVESVDLNHPPPPCDGSLRLVASFVHQYRPEQSFAAIVGATGTSLLYQEGMAVDGREVVAIGRQLVILRPTGTRACSIAMFSQNQLAQAVVPTPEPQVAMADPTATAEGGLTQAELDQHVRQTGPNSYAVSRSIISRIMANQTELIRSIRFAPQQDSTGQMSGVKIFGIRRSSVLARIGIKNGDTLRSINGYSFGVPTQALEALTKLQSANQLSLQLDRDGQASTMEYAVQ